jgi:hypothetical protein
MEYSMATSEFLRGSLTAKSVDLPAADEGLIERRSTKRCHLPRVSEKVENCGEITSASYGNSCP